MREIALWLVIATGCGRLQFDELPADLDGGPDAVTADCWPAWRSGAPTFTAPVQLLELAHPDDEGNPWLTADGLTLYYDSKAGVNSELYRATRPARDQAFAPRIAVAEVTSPLEDTGLVLTSDLLHAVFASSRSGSAGFDLWQTDRADPALPFETPTRTPYAAINDNNNQYDGYLTPDGLRIYYSTNVTMGNELRMASRGAVTSSFAAPVVIPGTGTIQVEADPDLSPDELVLAFSAQSPLRLHLATRSSTALAFGPPIPLSSISPTGRDADPAFSADGCELVFVSSRGGNRDLWHTTVAP